MLQERVICRCPHRRRNIVLNQQPIKLCFCFSKGKQVCFLLLIFRTVHDQINQRRWLWFVTTALHSWELHAQKLNSEDFRQDLRISNKHDSVCTLIRGLGCKKILKPCFEETAITPDPTSLNDVWYSEPSTLPTVQCIKWGSYKSCFIQSNFALMLVITVTRFDLTFVGLSTDFWAINTQKMFSCWPRLHLICDRFIFSHVFFSLYGPLSACNEIQVWSLLFIKHLLVLFVTHAAAVAAWKIAHQSEMFSLLHIPCRLSPS